MLTEAISTKEYLHRLFNDFSAGIFENELTDTEINYVIERYHQSSQKHINIRDGENSQRITINGFDKSYVYLSAGNTFKYPKTKLLGFIKRSASNNQNRLVTNAFRQSTQEGFEALIETQAAY